MNKTIRVDGVDYPLAYLRQAVEEFRDRTNSPVGQDDDFVKLDADDADDSEDGELISERDTLIGLYRDAIAYHHEIEDGSGRGINCEATQGDILGFFADVLYDRLDSHKLG